MAGLLEAGKICNVHGLKGTVKIQPWTDSPEAFTWLEALFIDGKCYEIENASVQKNSVLVKLEGVNNVNDAELLRDKTVYCERDAFGELPQDTYFVTDLIGCEVFTDGTSLGRVSDVVWAGGADVYEIKGETTIYLPAIKENIISIDIKNKIIEAKLPEGLI